MLSSYNVGAILSSPMSGHAVDRYGHAQFIFTITCIAKALAYFIYSINISAYFPLVGRFLAGIGGSGGVTVIFGQIALQIALEERSRVFVILEGVFCLGAAFGPALGSLVSFDATIGEWHINPGNSPGVVLCFIWVVFSIVSLALPANLWADARGKKQKEIVDIEDESKEDRTLVEDYTTGDRASKDHPQAELDDGGIEARDFQPPGNYNDKPKVVCNSRIICLLYLTFTSEVFSTTATFFVPILALNHFHLQLLDIQLLFINCTLFTLVVFIVFSILTGLVDERKLFLASLGMQIAGIIVLTSIGFRWNHSTNAENYVLLLYVCLGMPYFAYPFCNSIISKITDRRNAAFYQGSVFAVLQLGVMCTRVVSSFIDRKEYLIIYCFGLMFLWLVGLIWYSVHHEQYIAVEPEDGEE